MQSKIQLKQNALLNKRNSKRGEGGDPALIKNNVFWHAESHRILVFIPIKPQVSNWS